MTDALKRNPVPGWYAETETLGSERYWDGERWTDARRHIGAPSPAGATSRSNGLDIAALITAFLVGPVGLALGLVSMSKSRKSGDKPTGLAIAATVIGGFATVIGVISAVVTAIGLIATFGALDDYSAPPEFSEEVPFGEEPPNQGQLTADYCTAYVDAEPAIRNLLSFPMGDTPLSNGAEYAAELAPSFDEAFVAAEELLQASDAEGGSQSTPIEDFIAAAPAVEAELESLANGSGEASWPESKAAHDNAFLIADMANFACG